MAKAVVIPLEKARDRILVGGKAAALGELKRSGFNVPNGFVVTTQATETDTGTIFDWFDRLDYRLVAVRSSSVSEDGIESAWAGQLETFLDVSRDKLIERVLACRASANSARAVAYARQREIPLSPLAVLVQEMVPSEVSGVAFSVHPVTQDPQQMVIEAVFGLGEALVSGEITPDNYLVQKPQITVISQRLGTQAEQSTGQHGSTINKPVLSPTQLEELGHTVVALESHFGFPVDVEWAWAKQCLYILQCRPITALG
jgi:phosphoenolpyruvate synthase/pyruvate phosphate dikinase